MAGTKNLAKPPQVIPSDLHHPYVSTCAFFCRSYEQSVTGPVSLTFSGSDMGRASLYPFSQSLLCISHAADQLDVVGTALQTSGLWIFLADMPSDLSTIDPNIALLGAFNSTDPALVKGAPPIVRGEEIASLGRSRLWSSRSRPLRSRGGKWSSCMKR
jgi:hypothetical protein